jgi:hypothetical protein
LIDLRTGAKENQKEIHHAQSENRTRIATATTWSTNHYTNWALWCLSVLGGRDTFITIHLRFLVPSSWCAVESKDGRVAVDAVWRQQRLVGQLVVVDCIDHALSFDAKCLPALVDGVVAALLGVQMVRCVQVCDWLRC